MVASPPSSGVFAPEKIAKGASDLAKKHAPAPAGGWLFKEEPSHYSYADLERDGAMWWDGVENALARQHLRRVKVGDRVLYYHTGKERAIVGEMRVKAGPKNNPDGEDPKAVTVQVEAVRRWATPLTLEQIKKDARFAEWELLRISRLSIVPVSPEQWRWLEQLATPGGPQGT